MIFFKDKNLCCSVNVIFIVSSVDYCYLDYFFGRVKLNIVPHSGASLCDISQNVALRNALDCASPIHVHCWPSSHGLVYPEVKTSIPGVIQTQEFLIKKVVE